MGSRNNKQNNILTAAEQKTTTAFKLQSERITVLEKSLRGTQDELEKNKEKYHLIDKELAVYKSQNNVYIFHEVLKFFASSLCGGIGVNLITNHKYKEGTLMVLIALVAYTVIVFIDKKK